MSDRHDVLDRLTPEFPAPQHSLERFHRLRERKVRHRQIGAAVLALVVAAAAFFGLVRLFDTHRAHVPAGTGTGMGTHRPPLAQTLPGKIAFSGGGSVYVIDRRDTVQQVAGGSEEESSFVSWSGGGLIVRSALSKDPGHPCVCLIPSDRLSHRPYASGTRLNGYAPWDGASSSPRSGRLVFAKRGGLYLISGGGPPRPVGPPGGSLREPALSPDGSRIAFVSRPEGEPDQIYVMNANGTDALRVTAAGIKGDANREPAWSPDGSKLVFTRYHGDSTSDSDIYTMNADGSRVRRVIALPSSESRPSWSPDGSTIAFVSDGAMDLVTPDGFGLRRVPAPHQVTVDGGPAFPPSRSG